MSSIILQAHSLTKKYRHTVALDHIDLQIEKGKIYGFIGQNGAGKTTFLRLVTGLAFQTSGTLDLWGKSSAKDLQEQRKRIGCMIETPALFPAMTAYQNMEILLNIILQERRPFVCTLSSLFVRTQRGRMVD